MEQQERDLRWQTARGNHGDQTQMICPKCSSKTNLIRALASEQHLPAHQPNVFVQYRCEQGHYFVTLKAFDGTIYQVRYLTSDEQNPAIRASLN